MSDSCGSYVVGAIAQASHNKTSNEMPVIKKIHTGPYHCAALTDDGRVFTWGKGKYGVLGQGTEDNHYEPVLVEMDSSLPANLFITGEYHSLVVQDANRLDMREDYTLRPLPNCDDLVYIPESKTLSAEDLAARFRVDESLAVERYDLSGQGRTSKGQFSNIRDVTETGKLIVDKGYGTEEVEPDDINPARAKSLRGDLFVWPFHLCSPFLV